ncbi:hypothetical protein [Sphingobacterium sp. LRF_L2]|uniref:hypothetical protein n=1 Tax=Sphingobacterium sp. LRF_L2 TaxID=3369421 RepID=UPI003F63357A
MIKHVLLGIANVIAIIGIAMAQSDFSFPHPDKNTLGKLNSSAEVVPSTGQLSLKVPLFGTANANLNTSLYLSYQSGGIKYQEYASSVGLGWRLNGGGSITRVVRSFPDDAVNGYLGPGSHGKKIEAAFSRNEYIHNNYLGFEQKYDSEPDLYILTTPLFSVEFTFDADGNVVKSSEDGIMITPYNFKNNTNSNNNSYFLVIDASGNEYSFAQVVGNRDLTTEKIRGDEVTYTSVWHLDKIVNASKTETLNFYYSKYGTENETYNYYSWIRLQGSNPAEKSTYTQKFNKKYLTRISSKNGYLTLSYSNDRHDVEGQAPRLTSITAYRDNSKSIFLQKILFNYSYFGNTANSTSYKKSDRCRLRLDNLRIININEDSFGKPLNVFTYFSEDDVNNHIYDRTADRQDFSGYFTVFTSGNQMVDPELRQPYSLSLTKYCQLTRVTERSGSFKEFVYEHNTFNKQGVDSNYVFGGLRVQKILTYEREGAVPLKQEYLYSFNGKSSGIVHNTLYDRLLINDGWILDPTWAVTSNSIFGIMAPLLSYQKTKQIGTNNSSVSYEYEIFPDSIIRVVILDNYIVNRNHFAIKSSLDVSGSNNTYSYVTGSTINQGPKRNTLKKITHADANGRVIRTQEFFYKSLSGKKGGYGLKSFTYTLGAFSAVDYAKFVYYTLNESWSLDKEIAKMYDLNGDSMVQEKKYTYHGNNFLLRSSETKNSKGTIIKSTMYYPEDGAIIPMLDANQLPILNSLKAANVRNVVVHKSEEPSSNELLQTHNTFDVPYKLLSENMFRRISFNQTNEKLSSKEYYYESGNINKRLGAIKGESGRYNFVRYNEYDQMVVEVGNTVASSNITGSVIGSAIFFYEGFESQASLSRFAGLGSGASPYQVTFVGENGRRYFVDFWYMDAAGTWKYMKLPYTNNMNLNYGTRIDEVRVYPRDSQIKSYTYNVLGLKDSESNGSGQVRFYDYDYEKRLQAIRDEDGNVLKTYCYNLAGENVDCFKNLSSEQGQGCVAQAVQHWDLYSSDIVRSNLGLTINYLALGLQSNNSYYDYDWYTNGITVANLQGDCRPSTVISKQVSLNSTLYEISVQPSGDIRIKLVNRSSPMPQPGYLGTFQNIVF